MLDVKKQSANIMEHRCKQNLLNQFFYGLEFGRFWRNQRQGFTVLFGIFNSINKENPTIAD